MKEYWVNVYKGNQPYGHPHSSKQLADLMIENQPWGRDIIYRIHVKMDGGYNKRKVKPFPQRADMKVYYSKGWMG